MRDEMVRRANSEALLAWYDRHARDLPWRIAPGAGDMPDPYRVWLSEIMLQQTTVAAVKAYFDRFTALWPNVNALAAAKDAEVMAAWAGLGYYARARNLLKCAREIVDGLDGSFPDTRAGLLSLPGIGPYSSAAIAAIAFDRPETVVDGNVERVMARLHAVETPLPTAKPELRALAHALTPMRRAGDYAQAVMDLGATVCTPGTPLCGDCPWHEPCKARAMGIAAHLPRRMPKTPKPVRFGTVYIARRSDGAFLLETRPGKGLLGGMLGWPGSAWGADVSRDDPPIPAGWTDTGVEVRHAFTHFHLRLRVLVADVALDAKPGRGAFFREPAFQPDHLPTVMRKAYAAATPWPLGN